MDLKNLATRSLFALWSIPAGWFVVNATIDLTTYLPTFLPELKPIYPVHLLGIFLVLAALKEYNMMLTAKYKDNKFNLSFLWFVPVIISLLVKTPLFSSTTMVFILLALVTGEAFAVGKGTDRWNRASLMFSGTMFLSIAISSFFGIMDESYTSLWRWHFPDASFLNANIGFVFIIASVILSDTMAYFTGSLIGKHSLTSISPKKTIEGAIGGVVSSSITMTLGFLFLRSPETPIWLGTVLGIAIGIASLIGDLMVSSMKRYFNVKDSSHLIPGHGGILDRFDSLFFTLPVIHIVVTIFHKVIG